MSSSTPTLKMTNKIHEDFEAFERQVAAYHNSMIHAHSLLQTAVKQSKNSILEDLSNNSALINENEILKNQIAELTQDNEDLTNKLHLERRDADGYYSDTKVLEEKLKSADNRIKDLEHDHEENQRLFSKLGAYTKL